MIFEKFAVTHEFKKKFKNTHEGKKLKVKHVAF